MSWIKKPEPKTYVIELEKVKAPPETPEAIASIESLMGHSGFQLLLQKLRFQAARLKSDFLRARHDDLRAVDNFQNAIYWCEWLQSQLDFNHQRYLDTREATLSEKAFFDQIASQIDYVGRLQDDSEV